MKIERITTRDEFSADFARLAVWTFGPLCNLPADDDDGDMDEDDMVLLAIENGETVGYLTADRSGVWCVEVSPAHRGAGIASALITESGARRFCEVCSADGVALAEALGFEYDEA